MKYDKNEVETSVEEDSLDVCNTDINGSKDLTLVKTETDAHETDLINYDNRSDREAIEELDSSNNEYEISEEVKQDNNKDFNFRCI